MENHSMMKRNAFVVALVGAHCCWAYPPPPDPRGQLLAMYPEAKFYEPYGRTLTVSGTPMVRGADPQDAARRFLFDHADIFESEFADLVLDREVKLLNDRTVIFYHQEIDGFSVDGSSVRIMTRGADPAAVVYVAARVAKRPAEPFPAPRVTPAQALAAAQAHLMAAGLTQWTQPKLFAEYDDAPVGDGTARLVYRCAGMLGRSQSYTFFVEPATGQVRRVQNNILRAFADPVSGSVTGNASPSIAEHRRPDRDEGLPGCDNPPAVLALPYIRVQAWDQSPTPVLIDETFADRFGDYSLAVPNGMKVDVKVELIGPQLDPSGPAWKLLDKQPTSNPVSGTVTVTAPASGADLLLNASPQEKTTSQVNAFLNVAKTWEFYHDRLPDQAPILGLDFPTLVVEVNHPANIYCNAGYNELSDIITFFPKGTTSGPDPLYCQNTAYSTVVSHEFGHRLLEKMLGVSHIGIMSFSFHEGFSDSLALLTHDTEIFGEDYANIQCGTHVREPLDPVTGNVQYPACGSSHYMGQVLSGVWLRMHANSSFPFASVQQLFIDWSLIAEPPPLHPDCLSSLQSADPGTLIEVLVADDDDGNMANGTPHCQQILDAFALHGITPDGLPFGVVCGESAFSSGRACYADIDSSTGSGVLDILDYLAFQRLFLERNPTACDCDTSTGLGTCDIFDLVCFQAAFTLGCEKE